jgi:hypothetical protein
MAEYDNTNTGIISKNERKTADTHADISGSINIDGIEYWLDGYLRERKDGSGKKFYSLKARPKHAKPVTAAGQSYGQASGGFEKKAENKWQAGLADLNDEVPF